MAKKRANGEGNIRKRSDGRWEGRYTAGYNAETGKRIIRHTFATLAPQNGVDVKTVSSMLGHYDAGFTLRTYTHATRQKQDEAARTMGIFMSNLS